MREVRANVSLKRLAVAVAALVVVSAMALGLISGTFGGGLTGHSSVTRENAVSGSPAGSSAHVGTDPGRDLGEPADRLAECQQHHTRPTARPSCPAPSCWPPHRVTSRTPPPSPAASGRSAGPGSAGSTRARSSTSAPARRCSTTAPAPPRSPPRSTSCSPRRPCCRCSAPSTASPPRWSRSGQEADHPGRGRRPVPGHARRRRPPTRRGPRSPIWPRRPPPP